jgi:ATP-dependent RNA helicase RhlE
MSKSNFGNTSRTSFSRPSRPQNGKRKYSNNNQQKTEGSGETTPRKFNSEPRESGSFRAQRSNFKRNSSESSNSSEGSSRPRFESGASKYSDNKTFGGPRRYTKSSTEGRSFGSNSEGSPRRYARSSTEGRSFGSNSERKPSFSRSRENSPVESSSREFPRRDSDRRYSADRRPEGQDRQSSYSPSNYSREKTFESRENRSDTQENRYSSERRPFARNSDSRDSSRGSRFQQGRFSRDSGSRRGYGNGRGRRNMGKTPDHSHYINLPSDTKEGAVVAGYTPQHTFSTFGVNSKLVQNILAKKYTAPTEIQDKAIPEVMAGKDILGLSETGSGKTIAFLLPLIDKVLANPEGEKVLVITPTRELAKQIRDELVSLTQKLGVYSCLVTGGSDIVEQIRNLKRGVHFVIGTPGRIIDMKKRGILQIKSINNIVLDEVDHMLDMGFIDDIKTIIDELPAQKQCLFFSATMPDRVTSIADRILNNPVRVQVKPQHTKNHIHQDIVKIPKGDIALKYAALEKVLLEFGDSDRVLIFASTKRMGDKLESYLQERNFKCNAIHSDKRQGQRNRILRSFKEGETNILIGTDVVARGIDIPDVKLVVNFDEPESVENYTHRIGRTGRAGKSGSVITFVVQK